MKLKLFKGTSQKMSYIIVKVLFNKHQLNNLNLLKIFFIQCEFKRSLFAFFHTAKSIEVSMPLVNKF